MTAARIRRLTLTNFRSYRLASLTVGGDTVVLTGPNGAGKTNLIEAISFLAPGRGLRRATLDEVTFSEAVGGVSRGRRRARPRRARYRHRAERRRRSGDAAQVSRRPRAGVLGDGVRRPSADHLDG